MKNFIHFLIAICYLSLKIEAATSKPNIVFIVADDLGWNDVSYHGSDQIVTPNIDLLASTGITLNRYYSHCVCTPSRSALLTGKYAHTIGMQGYPLTNGEDRALPLTEKLLPEYLKDFGYSTHLVGKWHVGHSRSSYLPTARGFDTHFGHRSGFIDYYEYTAEEVWTSGKVSGLDMFRNLNAAWEVEGYLTDLYTDEAKKVIQSHNLSSPLFLMVAHAAPHSGNDGALLQAPPELVRKMRHVESPERRIYAAMVKKLDDSVGDIVETLQKKEMLNNTVIVFISDNGGMTSGDSVNYASNWPLRGVKMSPFEGGVRVLGLVWSLNTTSHRWDEYMHVSDWVLTLLAASGNEVPKYGKLDGINQWPNMQSNKPSDRDTIYEINDDWGFYSVINGEYKLVSGTVISKNSNHQGGDLRGIIGEPLHYVDEIQKSKTYGILQSYGWVPDHEEIIKLRNESKIKCPDYDGQICYPEKSRPCLFNIKEDPCEKHDLFEEFPEMVQRLETYLERELKRKICRVSVFRDPRAAPGLHNFTWTTFADSFAMKKNSDLSCEV